MNRIFGVIVAASLALAGCSSTPSTSNTVFNDIAAVVNNPAIAGLLDEQPEHSALGVLWADAKSAVSNGLPTPGVTPDWAGLVFGEVKALAPTVLPILIGLL